MTGDTRYNPLPARVAVPLYPCPRPGVRFVRALARGHHSPVSATNQASQHLAELLRVASRDIVFTDSGAAALTLALRAVRRAVDDEVLLPTFACPRMFDAVQAAGLTPVLCDVDGTGNIDADDVRARLSSRSRAVIAGHTFGLPADLRALRDLCAEAGLHLIDDAAQALGSSYQGKPVGTWGSYGILSFGRHKPVFAGGGGAIVRTGGPALTAPHTAPAGWAAGAGSVARACLLDALRSVSSSLPVRLRLQPVPSGDVTEVMETAVARVDPNSSLSWVGAAFLVDQLARLDGYQRRQQRHIARVRAAVEGHLDLRFPHVASGQPVNFLALRCSPERRHDMAAHLARRGVETTWLYYPLHRVRRYTHVWVNRGPFPRAETLWTRTLCVPCRGWHSDGQVDRLIAGLTTADTQRSVTHG
ncbi:DegT/DnrJ/EryC1/StrS family aminotransferase [Streptomyces phaeochromogenes]|uniref:DegT/DnrJ/EryC1/StrS family aminotransferase n=1 Tax=Streptomyces phaeochromogenes TaxID=1923 RepID=UPI0037249864